MDKAKLVKLASNMSTRGDLLNLLNSIHRAETHIPKGEDKSYPFTIEHLLYYCNPNHISNRYRKFKIKKKSGGFRQITAPRNQSFKMLLQAVNELFKALYTPSQHAMGFAEHRSVATNAAIHKGQIYVFNIDLKDFFPSIDQARVWKRLQLAPFNFPVTIASTLAGLCAMRESHKDENGKKRYRYVLPQGAPTSPIITNMICDTLDRRLAGLAKRFGLRYSRYADDITFSSMHHVYAQDGAFRKELYRIIQQQGFTVNDSKTRLQKRGSRQEVTGIIVSNKINVTKEYVREIRSLLYIWEKYGYSVAVSKFLPRYKAEKGHVKKGNSELRNVLDGKLMYLKMVKGEEDSVFQRLYYKFQKLISQNQKPKVSFLERTPLLSFEHNQSTLITFHQEGKYKRLAQFELGGTNQVAYISKLIPQRKKYDKENLYISKCSNRQGDLFWFIYRDNPALRHELDLFQGEENKPEAPDSDIDSLNNLLDSLLTS